jgi:hypothetical protein
MSIARKLADLLDTSGDVRDTNLDNVTAYTKPVTESISYITGLQSALDGKIDDSQVLTNVPSGAVFTDNNTTYSVGDGGLTQKNFTTALDTKLSGLETSTLSISANVLTFTDEAGTDTTIDLSLYLDDTNLAYIASGTVASNGTATFTRSDSTTFTVDMSTLLDDTKLSDTDIAAMGYTKSAFSEDDYIDNEILDMGWA